MLCEGVPGSTKQKTAFTKTKEETLGLLSSAASVDKTHRIAASLKNWQTHFMSDLEVRCGTWFGFLCLVSCVSVRKILTTEMGRIIQRELLGNKSQHLSEHHVI